MDPVVPLSIVLCILIILSAYFSATETAFSTMNRIRVKNWANNGNKKAILTLNMAENYDKLISNILIGNNIVNITAASLATILFTYLIGAQLAVTISTIVMTILVLIFGEIIPKTLAKRFPERFAMFSAPIIKFISFILYPISIIFILLQKLLDKMFKRQETTGVTNEELMTIIEEAQNDGDLDRDDGELIRSAIGFNDVDVQDVLVPRVDIVAIEKHSSMEDILQTFRESGYSRLPVYEDDIDHIIGFIHEKDFYSSYYDKKTNIRDIIQKIYCTTPQVKISELLKTLQQNKQHMAVVLDEFGGTDGLVTLEDCIEELVGEIYDEHDEVIEMYHRLADNCYIVNGGADLDETFELLNFKADKEFESSTVGGWALEELGIVPEKGFKFTYLSLQIEILETEFRRILSLKITNN